jgi:hypothetical protein
LVAIGALLAVVLGELDRLIASVPAGDGRSHSLNVALSPLALSKTDSWPAWADASFHRELGAWIISSALLDAGMVAVLFVLLWRFVHVAGREYQTVPTIVLLVYAASEFGEDVWQILAGWTVSAGDAPVAGWTG